MIHNGKWIVFLVPVRVLEVFLCFANFFFVINPARPLNRTDDESNDQRCAKRDDERERQILHKVANNAGPEEQRDKRRYGCESRCDDRNGDLGSSFLRCYVRRFVVDLLVAIDVLNYDDGIVHEYAQHQHKGKKDNEVQRNAIHRQDREPDKHRQRNRGRDQQRVLESKKHKQTENNQKHSRHDAVLQFPHHSVDEDGLIVGDVDFQARRQIRFPFIENRLDCIGYADEILSCPFLDGKCHNFIAVEAGVCQTIFERQPDSRDIADVHRFAAAQLHNNVFDGLDVLVLTRHANRIARFFGVNGATGYRDILVLDRIHDVIETNAILVQIVDVAIDLDLRFQTARYVRTQHSRNRLDLVLEIVGDILQPGNAIRSSDVDVHDRKLTDVDFRDDGFEDVGRQLGFCGIHFVAHAA